ncbi:MAG: PAS domain S-box protein, partial [Candidatus Eremiobacteraeota bacterium]|nr:PAS domain S-box protein [Candidatus Eremiobacteraeota bacterium]
FMGQSVFKVIPDSDRRRIWENLDLCLENVGQSNTLEVEKIRKDGARLWVRETAKAIKRSNGEMFVLIACEDITERKRAEKAARESARRFRALIEHAYDAVLLVDRNCTVLYASPSVERVLGYAPEELVGRDGFDLVHPDDLEGARKRFVEASDREGSVSTDEGLIRHKHGKWLWTQTSMTNLLAEPSVRAFVVNLRDIDARKRAEEALRESEHRFRDYAETASDWLWETGPDHRFTSFSHDLPALGAGIGMSRWDLAADFDEEPEKWRAHGAILEAHEPFRDFVYRAIREDGSTAWVSVSGKPVFDRQGRFSGYRGVSTDVSDRVRADEAERALQDARMELAHVARVTSLGELTASIAHEVNQPLAAVIMNAGAAGRWLNAEPPNLEEARRALASIARDGRRASDVIGRIRMMAKKEPILMDRFDINEAIREVLALTRGEIARNRVALEMKLADPAPLILGDRVQLQQVILNLVLNAVEAMSEDESRKLSIETGKDGGGNALVSVRDSGRSVDPARADRLFEPFYSTKPGGMGMGLAICRSILESHHGKIWARANPERGSTIAFAIPISTERAGDAE